MEKTTQKFFSRCSGRTLIALGGGLLALSAPFPALAHCPLCTVGAGAAAVTAKFFGAGTATVGVFIGAFAIALGSWTGVLLRKRFIPFQRQALEAVSFLSTVLPLKPLLRQDIPIPIFLWGSYGSLFNSTYTLDIFLLSAGIGGCIMLFSRRISAGASMLLKGVRIPYQGMIITFIGLVVAALILEILL